MSSAAQPAPERRWPMAVAVLVAIALTALLPSEVRPIAPWLLSVTGLLLVGLIIADPGRLDRPSRAVRVLTRVLLGVLAVTAALTTVLLIHELIVGGKLTRSATDLLVAGNAVLVANIIVFALLYWEIDGGGSAARFHHAPEHPDFAFPQHMNPELAPPGWRPLFIDYLYLGLTNSVAFSPTDAMPLAPWAKIAMGLQSTVSVAILGLVIARAVNVLA